MQARPVRLILLRCNRLKQSRYVEGHRKLLVDHSTTCVFSSSDSLFLATTAYFVELLLWDLGHVQLARELDSTLEDFDAHVRKLSTELQEQTQSSEAETLQVRKVR